MTDFGPLIANPISFVMGAAAQLAQALRRVDGRCDVIILGRGGGSAEDLSPFNDEGLARAVAACGTPVVSAVGHETDVSICDLVADLRAPTPSAAAELVSPQKEELCQRLDWLEGALRTEGEALLSQKGEELARLERKLAANSPEKILQRNGQRLGYLVRLLANAYKDSWERRRSHLGELTASLSRLNPAAVLTRGFTITTAEGRPVTSVEQLVPGQEVTTRFADGEMISTVRRLVPKEVHDEKRDDL